MGCLYQIEFPNGKSYIGMTASDPLKRWWEHRYQAKAGAKWPVYAAMRKFGLEAIRFTVLVVSNSREYLADLERKAIAAFCTRSPLGYNCTDGGDGAPIGNTFNLGKRRSAESRARMSASASRTGRRHSDETKAKIGAAAIGNQYALGRKQGDEEKLKRSLSIRCRSKATNASGHVGVSVDRQTGKWRAHLTVNHKMIHLGRYASIDDAVSARKRGEAKYFSVGGA